MGSNLSRSNQQIANISFAEPIAILRDSIRDEIRNKTITEETYNKCETYIEVLQTLESVVNGLIRGDSGVTHNYADTMSKLTDAQEIIFSIVRKLSSSAKTTQEQTHQFAKLIVDIEQVKTFISVKQGVN